MLALVVLKLGAPRWQKEGYLVRGAFIIYPSSIYDFGLHNNIVIFQCVIDWLENCAQESINHYRENVHFFSNWYKASVEIL
jgi:hypothetical protein